MCCRGDVYYADLGAPTGREPIIHRIVQEIHRVQIRMVIQQEAHRIPRR